MMTLQIYSPEETLVETTVESVTLPGVLGSFQVLKGHAALISALEKGTVRYVSGGETHTLEIAAGFVKVEDDEIAVCVEK